MPRILIIGILLVMIWLSISAAIVSAAPYLAAFAIVVVAMLLLSKGGKGPPKI